MGYEFTKKYAIETYDFDRYGKVKITSLMNVLQDISTVHFNQVTQGRIENSSGIWVIVEWDFNVIAPPEKPCEIMVTTEPIYFRKFIAYRKYTLRDQTNRILGTAISKWAYIDLELRKNTSIPNANRDINTTVSSLIPHPLSSAGIFLSQPVLLRSVRSQS